MFFYLFFASLICFTGKSIIFKFLIPSKVKKWNIYVFKQTFYWYLSGCCFLFLHYIAISIFLKSFFHNFKLRFEKRIFLLPSVSERRLFMKWISFGFIGLFCFLNFLGFLQIRSFWRNFEISFWTIIIFLNFTLFCGCHKFEWRLGMRSAGKLCAFVYYETSLFLFARKFFFSKLLENWVIKKLSRL